MEGLSERTRWIRGSVERPTVFYAGLKMTFDPVRAQKTGLFLDQRFNLEFLKKFCEHKKYTEASMLDVCSYAGAWSAAAALGGVRKFTFIDADTQALKLAPMNVLANALGCECCLEPRHGDLFEELSKLKNEARTFDIVVADPPAFAKTKKHLPEATLAYSRLTKSAARLVKDGGLLVMCSCSKHMDADTFWNTVTRALGTSWILVHRGGQSTDHSIGTTPASTEYLKCLFFQRRDFV
jgi:23S rRNA (cytosine1962-C5)-methyltransferase